MLLTSQPTVRVMVRTMMSMGIHSGSILGFLSTQAFDLAGGALGGVGRDPLHHRHPLLELLQLLLQLYILRADRIEPLLARPVVLLHFRLETVPGPDPVVGDPADRRDQAEPDHEFEYVHPHYPLMVRFSAIARSRAPGGCSSWSRRFPRRRACGRCRGSARGRPGRRGAG